jgi:MFS family permease
MPETCRNVVGNGSVPARGWNQSILGYLQQRKHAREARTDDDKSSISQPIQRKKKSSFPNPLRTLKIVAEKESGLILLYNGLFFTGMMTTTAAIPTLYKKYYGLNVLQIGLCFISMGGGSLLSALTTGHIVDWNFRRHARRLGVVIHNTKQQDLSNFPIEQVRFQVAVPGHIIGTLAFIAFGWTIKFQTSLAGPEVALFFIGFGVSTAFNNTNTLLIDLHRDEPATATAAVNFARCLMSAGGAAAIIPMCNAMNPGWAFTFIALLYVVLIFMVFLLMSKGMKWRQEEAKRKEEEGRKSEEHQKDIEAQEQTDCRGPGDEKDIEATVGRNS